MVSWATRSLQAAGLVSASAVFFHLLVVYGGNIGCVESVCYRGVSNAPSVRRSKASTANVSFIGSFSAVTECEAACVSFKVLLEYKYILYASALRPNIFRFRVKGTLDASLLFGTTPR